MISQVGFLGLRSTEPHLCKARDWYHLQRSRVSLCVGSLCMCGRQERRVAISRLKQQRNENKECKEEKVIQLEVKEQDMLNVFRLKYDLGSNLILHEQHVSVLCI